MMRKEREREKIWNEEKDENSSPLKWFNKHSNQAALDALLQCA